MSLSGRALARVVKEKSRFIEETEGSAELRLDVQGPDVWHVHIIGAEDTIYRGERYTLRVQFNNEYPMDSPEVTFLLPAPVHPHIYSNGHICLNILYDEWSPALTVRTICLSILSMMSSSRAKLLPEDDARYSSRPRGNPKLTRFAYHDDTV